MADIEYQVAFEGLREFQRLLKALPDEVKDELRATNKQLAEIVAAEARRRANSRPDVKNRTFGIAQSIKTGNVLREPTIRVGAPEDHGRATPRCRSSAVALHCSATVTAGSMCGPSAKAVTSCTPPSRPNETSSKTDT